MHFELRRLSPAVGVELLGVDLHVDQPTVIQDQVRDAWLEHGLVLVRGQVLSIDEQRRFARWFGAENTRSGTAAAESQAEETYISNVRKQGVAREGSLLLHQDHCFLESLLPGICLYAEEVTSRGGATVFANALRAYERLPSPLAKKLSSLCALHIFDPATDYGNNRFRVATASEQSLRAVHPVVVRHPHTGRPVLHVNRLMTDSIVGVSAEESEAILDELMTYFEGPEVRYEHIWRQHDVVVWDNISLQHGRTEFPAGERRSLRRLQIG